MATCTTSTTPMNVPPPEGAIPLTVENQRDDSEGIVVQRAQRGEEQALATLYQLHNKLVYSVCLRMTNDAVEAEDLVQEAFIQAFRNLNSFHGNSAFSTWLYRIAVNTVLMKLRRKSPPVLSLDESTVDCRRVAAEPYLKIISRRGAACRVSPFHQLTPSS